VSWSVRRRRRRTSRGGCQRPPQPVNIVLIGDFRRGRDREAGSWAEVLVGRVGALSMAFFAAAELYEFQSWPVTRPFPVAYGVIEHGTALYCSQKCVARLNIYSVVAVRLQVNSLMAGPGEQHGCCARLGCPAHLQGGVQGPRESGDY